MKVAPVDLQSPDLDSPPLPNSRDADGLPPQGKGGKTSPRTRIHRSDYSPAPTTGAYNSGNWELNSESDRAARAFLLLHLNPANVSIVGRRFSLWATPMDLELTRDMRFRGGPSILPLRCPFTPNF